ncbi:MAG: transposase, partial [Bacteroidota bacterium]|nr:transposase [Bacteroidota bacterium]
MKKIYLVVILVIISIINLLGQEYYTNWKELGPWRTPPGDWGTGKGWVECFEVDPKTYNFEDDEFKTIYVGSCTGGLFKTTNALADKPVWINLTDAKKFLGSWVAKAIASGIKLMKKFAHLLLAHRTGIYNWFYYRISTGPLEGMNNKIKVLKRKAYGYRDVQYFKLKIYNL